MLDWFSRTAGNLHVQHGKHYLAAAFVRPLLCDRRGTVAVMVAVSAVPIMIAVGAGIDVSRLAGARATLQNAADAAALAGAGLYTSADQSTTAQNSAQAYFDRYARSTDLTVSTRTATAAPASNNASLLTVTVSVAATMPTTFARLIGVNTMNLNARSVAAIPSAQPVIVLGAGGGSYSQVLAASGVKSTAADWNSVYMYGVPKSGSTPRYDLFPPLSQFYEVGSNCNEKTDANWTPSSPCNGGFGAIAPQNTNFNIPQDQPIAFMFVNMNNGMFPLGANGNYGPNQYGSKPSYYQLMTTATMSLEQSPSQITDRSVSIIATLGFRLSQDATHYSDVNNSAKSNCAIQIQLVDPTNLPTEPPYPRQCLAANDSKSGYQYANLSCNQIAGRTFMYWWNDMGAHADDFDYKNLYFTLTCVPGATNPDGGTINNNLPPQGSPPTLIQ